MSDYESITAAFKQAGLEFRVSRNDQHWKVISINEEHTGGQDLPGGIELDFYFKPDWSFSSVMIEG